MLSKWKDSRDQSGWSVSKAFCVTTLGTNGLVTWALGTMVRFGLSWSEREASGLAEQRGDLTPSLLPALVPVHAEAPAFSLVQSCYLLLPPHTSV